MKLKCSVKIGKKIQQRIKQLQLNLNRVREPHVNVGILAGATYPDGTPVGVVALMNEFGTRRSPARPFVRYTINEKKDIWNKSLGLMLKNSHFNVVNCLNTIGQVAVTDLQETITTGADIFVANTPYTIAHKSRKQENSPLYDTGHMQQSISWEVIS